MADKRFIVQVSSDGDSALYYNAENTAGTPAFQGLKFIEEKDAACIAKAKKGKVYVLEPKEVKKPKPYNPFPVYLGVLLGVIVALRYPVLLGLIVPETPATEKCPVGFYNLPDC
ncbi:MAG: hypothetical protein AAGA67_09840 [Cyanobacteria bacterium P01_F01_bin.153]